jgi:phosphatidate cytidylyltransferase
VIDNIFHLVTHHAPRITLMKRILTAIVALPILLFSVWSSSPYFFVALTSIAVILALGEFYALASKAGCKPERVLGYAAAIAVIASFVFQQLVLIVAVSAVLTILLLASQLSSPTQMEKAVVSVSATVFGVIYVAVLSGYLIGVRMLPDAALIPHMASKLLTMFFAIVMLTDTGAYYTGRAFGDHKLAPRISPGKTIEGAVGGLAMAIIVGPVCKLTFFPEIPIAHAIALGAAIGILGQIGDLAESMLKRGAGVKDSGNLLPGHGGMLDRVDSLLFCAPILFYYSRLLVAKF